MGTQIVGFLTHGLKCISKELVGSVLALYPLPCFLSLLTLSCALDLDTLTPHRTVSSCDISDKLLIYRT